MLTPAQQILRNHSNNLLLNCIMESNREVIENVSEVYQNCVLLFKSNMSIVNNMAYISMMNAYDIIKATPLYKGIVKKNLNDAVDCFRKHEIRLRESNFFKVTEKGVTTHDALYEIYQDAGAYAYDRAQMEVEQLRMQLYNALIASGKNKYTFELSHFLLAVYLLDYTQLVYGILIKDLKRITNINLKGIFSYFLIDDVRHRWRNCIKSLSANVDKDGKMTEYLANNITTAFNALEVVVMQDMQTQNSLNKAIRDNSHLLTKKEFREYCLDYDRSLKEYEEEHGKLRHSETYYVE